MPLAGFSEEDPPLAIGYYLGLRWFQAILVSHDQFSLNRDGSAMVMMTCGCGEVGQAATLDGLQAWYDRHCAASTVVLNGARARWHPGVNLATCGFNCTHRVPDRECGCGFWSYWRLGDQQVAAPHIAALIKGTGKIIKGPLGFRCSQAEILALVVPYGTVPFALDAGNLSDEGTLLALALEETYAPVYSSIAALLENYTAPEDQPPLGDDWYCHPARQQSAWATGGPVGYTAGTHYAGSSPATTTTWNLNLASPVGLRAGGVAGALRAGLAPCAKCMTPACSPGQAYCVACQLEGAARWPVRPATQTLTQTPITGVDALGQLHARRDSWAGAPIMGPPDPAGRGASIRWGLNYIRRKFGR